MMLKLPLPIAAKVPDMTKPLSPYTEEALCCVIDMEYKYIIFSDGHIITVEMLVDFLRLARAVADGNAPITIELMASKYSYSHGDAHIVLNGIKCDAWQALHWWKDHISELFGEVS